MLFEGLATMAAPDEPLRGLSNPAGPAFVEGRRWGVGATLARGESAAGNPTFVHAFSLVEGRDGQGWALWARYGGRDALGGAPPGPVTELSVGYTYAMAVSPGAALGLSGHYRRVRASASESVRDDHYLGLDIGLLAALSEQVVAAARIGPLLEIGQSGLSGRAEERIGAVGPALSAGLAYQANDYLILEADALDLLNLRTGRAIRLEARLYPAPAVALRLGVEQNGPESGWFIGTGVEVPGRGFAASYAYLGGEAYGGVHQLGIMAAAP